jgi:hypothetical protein
MLENLKLPEKYLKHLPGEGNGGLLDNPGHSGHLRTGSDVIYRQEELLHEVLKATRLKTSPILFQKFKKILNLINFILKKFSSSCLLFYFCEELKKT